MGLKSSKLSLYSILKNMSKIAISDLNKSIIASYIQRAKFSVKCGARTPCTDCLKNDTIPMHA